MIKTYSDFTAVISGKFSLYAQIPSEHLSVHGQQVFELYQAVQFLASFASCATDLLEILNDDEDVEALARYAGSELRQIRKCLERLAAAEKEHTV